MRWRSPAPVRSQAPAAIRLAAPFPRLRQSPGCGKLLPQPRTSGSHIGVIGAAAAFGRHPGDVLRRVFDLARFAMQAVGGIDVSVGSDVGAIVAAGNKVVAVGNDAGELQAENAKLNNRQTNRLREKDLIMPLLTNES